MEDYSHFLETNIPAKRPVGDCAGWLLHNSRMCDCYAAERLNLEQRESAHYGTAVAFVMGAALMAAILTA